MDLKMIYNIFFIIVTTKHQGNNLTKTHLMADALPIEPLLCGYGKDTYLVGIKPRQRNNYTNVFQNEKEQFGRYHF